MPSDKMLIYLSACRFDVHCCLRVFFLSLINGLFCIVSHMWVKCSREREGGIHREWEWDRERDACWKTHTSEIFIIQTGCEIWWVLGAWGISDPPSIIIIAYLVVTKQIFQFPFRAATNSYFQYMLIGRLLFVLTVKTIV